jgi:hypothetical protein
MSPDIAPCTNAFGRDRLKSAEAYLQAAATIVTGEEMVESPYWNNAVITNSVYAGIAASDAICCFELKAHSSGDDHRQATAQLKKVKHDGPALAKALADLLALKTRAGYGARPLPDNDVKRAERAAHKLVEAARGRRP